MSNSNSMIDRSRYEKYMTSTRWAKRREQYFRTHDKRCAGCGTDEGIQLHHRDYERLGCEEDSDLWW